jgi:hypothetical protein
MWKCTLTYRYEATLAWKAANDIDTILEVAHPDFDSVIDVLLHEH